MRSTPRLPAAAAARATASILAVDECAQQPVGHVGITIRRARPRDPARPRRRASRDSPPSRRIAMTRAKSTQPSPGVLNAPFITACRKLQPRLRAIRATAGRTSLQWTWTTRATCFASSVGASPPANVTWPVSCSSPTSGPVDAHQPVDVVSGLDVSAHVMMIGETDAARERMAGERGDALAIRRPLGIAAKARPTRKRLRPALDRIGDLAVDHHLARRCAARSARCAFDRWQSRRRRCRARGAPNTSRTRTRGRTARARRATLRGSRGNLLPSSKPS